MLICYLLLLTMQCFSLWGLNLHKASNCAQGCKLPEMHQSIDKKARNSHQQYLHTHSQIWNAKPFLQELLLKENFRFKALMRDTGLKANLCEVSPAFPSRVLEQISMCRDTPAGRIPPQNEDSAHSHWDSPALPAPSQFAAGIQCPGSPRIWAR